MAAKSLLPLLPRNIIDRIRDDAIDMQYLAWLVKCGTYYDAENTIPPKYLHDKKFMLQAVKLRGEVVKLACPFLRSDIDVAIAAVSSDSSALGNVHKSLRRNKTVVLHAVRRAGSNLRYLDGDLRIDFDVVMEAVKNDGEALGYVGATLRNNKAIVMAAVQQNCGAFACASAELRADPEVVSLVLRNDQTGHMLEYVRDNRDLVLECVQRTGGLKYLYTPLRGDREITLAAVKVNGVNLQYAIDEYKNDKEVVLAALRQNTDAIEWVSDTLCDDEEVMMEALRRINRWNVFKCASKRLRNDESFKRKIEDSDMSYAPKKSKFDY